MEYFNINIGKKSVLYRSCLKTQGFMERKKPENLNTTSISFNSGLRKNIDQKVRGGLWTKKPKKQKKQKDRLLWIRNQMGQSLIEYMVIVALMAVGTIGVMRILSQTTSGKLAVIVQSLQGGKSNTPVKFEKVRKEDLRKKDMGNFFRGSRSQRTR